MLLSPTNPNRQRLDALFEIREAIQQHPMNAAGKASGARFPKLQEFLALVDSHKLRRHAHAQDSEILLLHRIAEGKDTRLEALNQANDFLFPWILPWR